MCDTNTFYQNFDGNDKEDCQMLFCGFFSHKQGGGVTLQISKIISAKKLQGKGLNTKTSQELRMLSRSLTDCKLLLLTVMM